MCVVGHTDHGMKTAAGTKDDLRQWLRQHNTLKQAHDQELRTDDYYREVIDGWTVDTRDYDPICSRIIGSDQNGHCVQTAYRAGEHYVVYERTVVTMRKTLLTILRRVLAGCSTTNARLSQAVSLAGFVFGTSSVAVAVFAQVPPLFILTVFFLMAGVIPLAAEFDQTYDRGIYNKDVTIFGDRQPLQNYLGGQMLDDLPDDLRPPRLTQD